ncbi:armadillo-type protein [Astrocystis sublimbata]|nr:armadillo-type protein [Astrocystis sublimbata]
MDENAKVGKEDYSVASVSETPSEKLMSLLKWGPNSASYPKTSTGALSTSLLINQSCPKGSGDDLTRPNVQGQLLSLRQRGKQKQESFGHLEVPDEYLTDPAPCGSSKESSILPSTGGATSYSMNARDNPALEDSANSGSVPVVTPTTESFPSTTPATRSASATVDESVPSNGEVLRLKFELAQAHKELNRLEERRREELASRQGHSGVDLPTSISPVNTELPGRNQSAPTTFPRNPALHPVHAGTQYNSREGGHPWSGYDDSRSDTSDALSATGFNGFNGPRSIWGGMKQTTSGIGSGGLPPPDMPPSGQWVGRASSHSLVEPLMPYDSAGASNMRHEQLTPDLDFVSKPPGGRRGNRYDTRFGEQGFVGTGQSYNNQPGYSGYAYNPGQYDPNTIVSGGSQNMGAGAYSSYQSTPVGTPLSALASEFTSMPGDSGPWKPESYSSEGQTYLPTTEPLNYRRLLDRNANCNWKYIVDKIVCSNDQQASIFLQQKLKVGTPDQKYEIVEAIVAQAYPLMVNRFGNFLVQRCFEHGTPEQVIKIAEAIRGCTLTLSMDAFGCHVVQKAFDSVPEDYKAIMVHELLRRIPDTVIHRYACHVWQKLFELRWTESPPQIMKYVNEALRGMWHEVALGETGSLVVQNIFENCLEEDKRLCIEEVLSNINIVAHGQFGNWCIQHICEHGSPADRSRAIDHVIRYAAEYSMDQYASKVVEKCLKIGGAEFLARYLDRVCEGRMNRPRIPLIDIASDQYGNYLIQWILQHANPQHKEVVAAHIRKHMVSLRGSKFGSRVGMLCTNPAVATRPGPGVGPGVSRMPAGPRYGGRGYQ